MKATYWQGGLAKAIIALASLLTASSASAEQIKTSARAIAVAVSAPGRPESATKLDVNRQPAQVLAFMAIRPGMVVADVISGTGYWAELMGRVVGPQGRVTAFEPEQFYADAAGQADWRTLMMRQPNVTLIRYPFEKFAAPSAVFDAAIINTSYHDLYWESAKYRIPRADPAAFVRALYAAMKSGGSVVVIDHVGKAGDTRAIVEAVHRIDPAVVKADFATAGFRLVNESAILANAADKHDINVFDPAVRGKTDRFMYRFVKPE